jgi:O-antigen ligase
MGSGFWRIDPVSDRYVGVAPHSEYIQEYLRVGVLGTVFMFFFAIRPLSRLWRISKLDPTAVYPSASAWGIIVFMTLVYGVTYGIEPHAYALIGIANAIALKVHAPAAEPQQDFAEDWSLEALPSFAE